MQFENTIKDGNFEKRGLTVLNFIESLDWESL